jgi:hypothetical protein
METVHKEKKLVATPYSGPLCGRGVGRMTKRNSQVTCGRCKLLAKFAAKRAKNKGK